MYIEFVCKNNWLGGWNALRIRFEKLTKARHRYTYSSVKFWVSIIILAIVFMNVGTAGHEFMEDSGGNLSHSLSLSEHALSKSGKRATSLQSQSLSDKDGQSKKDATATPHSCHLGHCSFVLPFNPSLELQQISLVHSPINKHFSPVDLFQKRKPPKA